MKKILYITGILVGLFVPIFSYAQFTLISGGTGWGTSTSGDILIGTSSTLRYTRLAASSTGTVLQSQGIGQTPKWVATSSLNIPKSSGAINSVQLSDGSGGFAGDSNFTFDPSGGRNLSSDAAQINFGDLSDSLSHVKLSLTQGGGIILNPGNSGGVIGTINGNILDDGNANGTVLGNFTVGNSVLTNILDDLGGNPYLNSNSGGTVTLGDIDSVFNGINIQLSNSGIFLNNNGNPIQTYNNILDNGGDGSMTVNGGMGINNGLTTTPFTVFGASGDTYLGIDTTNGTITTLNNTLEDGSGGASFSHISVGSCTGCGSSQWTTSGSNIYYNAGSVGIGTVSPGAPLHLVRGTSGGFTPVTDETMIIQRNSSSADNNALTMVSGSNGVNLIRFTKNGATEPGRILYSENTNFMEFDASSSERMRITGNGNVGIGTVSPSTLLQVNGTTTATCFSVSGTCINGTVTSVSGSGGTTGLTLTGGAITTSGTLTLGGTLSVANGGTGVTSTSTLLSNLALVPLLSGTSTDYVALTAAQPTINTFKAGSATTSVDVRGYVNIHSIATDVAVFRVSYTDENGTAQTYSSANLSTTGGNPIAVGELRLAPNTVASTSVALTTAIGSISYGAGATITLIK